MAANLYRRTGGTTPHASTCRAEIEPNTQEDLTLVWTAEKIAGLGVDQVKDLRGNAAKRGAQGIVDLCDAELVRRRARRRTKRSNSSKQIHNGETVHGFHFVCPTEKGITRNQDGTIWTGTWVVDKNHAKRCGEDRRICCFARRQVPTVVLARLRKGLARSGARADLRRRPARKD